MKTFASQRKTIAIIILLILVNAWHISFQLYHVLDLGGEVDSPPRGVPWKRLKTAKKSTKAARGPAMDPRSL